MLESEETKWRLGVEPEQAEERAAELSSEKDVQKEELQQTIQARADEIGGGGGEGSIVAEQTQEPIADAPKKKERKTNALTVKKSEPDTSKSMAKQIERHANQLTRIEKAITSLQNSINKIDNQSNTIKQIHMAVTQLQKQIRSSKNRKQLQVTQKKEIGKKSSKKRQLKGRR
jgi:chromosome segregation ATPase